MPTEGVGGDVGGEVEVRAGDDVEELAVVPQHLEPRSELGAPLQDVLLGMRLNMSLNFPPESNSREMS